LNNYYLLGGTGVTPGPCDPILVGNCPSSPTTYCGTVNTYSLYPAERLEVSVGATAFTTIKPITMEVYKNGISIFYDVLREGSFGVGNFISYSELIQGSNNYLVKMYDQPPALSSTPTPTQTKTQTPTPTKTKTPTITKSPTPTKTRP
jgi:hypothetical protein